MERRDNGRDRVDTVKDDTKDMLDEAKHRVKAGSEKITRAVEGGAMPPGERLASHAKEIGHNVKADVDKAKRELRDEGV